MYGHTIFGQRYCIQFCRNDDNELRECMLSLFVFAMQINQTEQAGLRHTFGKCRLIDHCSYFRYFKEVFWLNWSIKPFKRLLETAAVHPSPFTWTFFCQRVKLFHFHSPCLNRLVND